jgi:hypothetical protein
VLEDLEDSEKEEEMRHGIGCGVHALFEQILSLTRSSHYVCVSAVTAIDSFL